MPDNSDMELARQWVVKARNDLLNADNNLRAEEVPYDTVCFHCQQSAEKLLKAYLVANGRQYPVSHDLMLILEAVLALSPEAGQLRDSLALLIPYAVEVRYPDDWYSPSEQDAAEARSAADDVLTWLESMCPELLA